MSMSTESKPASPGTYYGESSPQGQWWWDGTGLANDDWVPQSLVPKPSTLGVEPQAAPADGTAVAGTTTLATLFSTVYGTLSGDLGTPTYVWSTSSPWPSIQARFTAGTTPTAQSSIMVMRFEKRPLYPSTIAP